MRDQIRLQDAIFAGRQEIRCTQDQTGDLIVNSYRECRAAYHRIFEKYDRTIRGVEACVEPGTNTRAELPYGYNDAGSNDSDYIMSSDPRLDLNGVSTQNWQRLDRQR
jgi:hypothetical protein